MVGLNGMDHSSAFLVFPGQLHAQLDMAAFHLMVYRFTQIVEETRPLGQGHIHAQLRSQQACNVGHLNGVVQNVLAVRSAVFLAAQNLDELRMQVVHAGLIAGPLSLFFDGPVHFFPGLFHHVLDAGGVNAAVGNQLLQSQPGNLPADGIKGGDGNGLGGVVDDQVDAGDGLQRPDVPALPGR